MKYLPLENITFKSKLKEAELINRLLNEIEPEKTFRFGMFGRDSTKTYSGHIKEQTFEIKRIISYRNSFLPRISGIVINEFDRTIIKVKMRLSIFVIIFLCLWSSGVGLLCLTVLPEKIRNSGVDFSILIPIGMLLFLYALTMAGFKFESNKSKKDLQKIFEAEIIDP
jgi:hypothetical protein